MPMYVNIGGGAKQLTSLYTNINGSSKSLTNAYTNISGTSKEIFTATKYYWYKRYAVSGWEMVKSSSNWNSDTEDDSLYGESDWRNSTEYGFSDASITSDGNIYLSGPTLLTWAAGESGSVGSVETYSADLNNTNFYYDYYWPTKSYAHTVSLAFFISSGYYYSMGSSGLEYTKFNISYNVHGKPTGHSNNYTLIKVKSNYKDIYAPATTNQNSDGSYPYSGYYYIENNSEAGYGIYKNYDDYTDSNGNHTDVKYIEYDGYYWEYEGYHY